MPARRISATQALVALFVIAALLWMAYALAPGPRTVAADGTAAPAAPAPGDEIAIARVVAAEGEVTIVRPPKGSERYTRYLRPVKEGLPLFAGDQVWTGAGSWVEIDFGDEVRVRVDPRTRAEVVSGLTPLSGPDLGEEKPSLRLYLGEVWASVVSLISRFTNFSIETPTAIAGVRGTLFNISVDVLGNTSVSVNEGIVSVSTFEERATEVLVASGELTRVIAGQRPDPPTLITPEVEREWINRSEWVLAHFDRKSAYEERWALADRGVAEAQPAPGELSAASVEEARAFADVAAASQSAPGPAPSSAPTSTPTSTSPSTPPSTSPSTSPSTAPSTPPSATTETQPASPSGSVGLASVTVEVAQPTGAAPAASREGGAGEDDETGDEGDNGDKDDKDDEDAKDDKSDQDDGPGEGAAGRNSQETSGPESGSTPPGGSGGPAGGGSGATPRGESRREPPRSDAGGDGAPRGADSGAEVARRVAEELENAIEKISDTLEEAGIELDRFWADLESAIRSELDELGERVMRLSAGEDRLRPFETILGFGSRRPGGQAAGEADAPSGESGT